MSDTTGSPGSATDDTGEPSTSSPSADAVPSQPADDPPVEASAEPGDTPDLPAGADAEAEVDAAQPVAVPGEQIEWQPVSSGDSITWQPVVAGGEGGAGPDWEEPDDAGEWAGAGAAAGEAGMSANGAAGAGYDPEAPTAGPARIPAGPRSVAARRRAQAAVPSSPPAGDQPATAPAADKTRRQVILLSVLTVGIVAIGVLAFVLSRGALDEGEEAGGGATTPTSTRTAPTLPESEFQGYRDEATGFSLRYPKAWIRYVPASSDYRLAVAIQPPDTDGFWVRVYPIQTEATEANIQNFKAVTDTIAFGDGSAKLIQEQLVRVNGRLAYYYLYTFEDEFSRNQGIHAHYFIFEGQRMFSLVFQSIPSDDFARQAGIFDQIAESFQAEPPRPGATTTTPPTTAG